ncbi:uncharacterized protein LOC128021096 isoform X1 [Carassius gibelio]|uniref:uncharacterized protein LOC128021096 isoform X1 n=1 Tax=Carassius gibelio TaxID=101364 RepID=UPI00227883AB|nr:uncharacterized protein LOC128021096 isoform X1 [Carassius gibelio]
MPDRCAAANCEQSTDQSNVSFFRFPLDPVRCKQWVGKCQRPDLETKTPEDLHRNYKLCSKHFETSMICQQIFQMSVLKDDAVPTVFSFATNQDNSQTGNIKRTWEKTGEEPVATKKSKGTINNSNPSLPEAQDKVESDSAENSETLNPPAHEESEEDPAISKAKETLKDYFKETLAFIGFSIANNASLNVVKPLGNDPAGSLSVNTICAEKIDQKEVLTLGEDVMREEIRNSLRLARFFSISLQDKVNIDGKDQIPVFIRSVTSEGFPQKHLMGFLPCDVDSESLFLMLISEIRNKWGLRMEHCRGFTYLSSGAMCQKLKDLSCRMLQDFPQVVLSPSEPYAFNVWLIRSMPILLIQDVVDTLEQVASIIRQLETLAKKLDAKIIASYSHIKGEVDRVKESCQNHWEHATDAFQTMLDILEPLLSSIGEMCTSALSDVDADTVVGLLMLKEKLMNFNFIITLVVLKNTLCCVSILNPSLKGIINISSTLQYTISNTLKLLNKHMQEINIFHRKWFSDAVARAKKLGVPVDLPVEMVTNGDGAEKLQASLEDYYREALSKKVIQYLVDEVKRVLGTEMARNLRWLSLVPSYMADLNFSVRKNRVTDANLNNLARFDSFYDELGCWEVKWRNASKQRILPTSVFGTLKIPDIGFYPNVQSLLRVLGTIPCVRAESDVYEHYDMVLDRYHSYMKELPAEKRLSNMAFVYVNQDVHFSVEEMVEAYVKKYPEILQLLREDDVTEVQPSVPETSANDASKEDTEEQREMTLNMDIERPKLPEYAETDKEAFKSALQAAVTTAYSRQSRHTQGDQDQELEYVTKSEMNEVLKVCEDVVRDRILLEAGNSFFSLFIDRVVRFGETEYIPMFIRFVDSFDVMRLELLGFIEVRHDTEAMCERLFDVVTNEWRLDLSYCRGQAYLGSGDVSYKLKAFACKIQEKYPLAICTHCSCYSFNTWWSRSVPVAAVIRAIDTLEEIVSFFHSMPALEKALDQVLAIGLRESYEKIHELQGKFCSTWLEKHDSYEVFAQILEPLVDWLENIDNCKSQRWSSAVSNRAKRLLQLIRDFEFIVAIVALKNASSFTKELSAALQKDHFSATSQLKRISGIVAKLNRVKTKIKVFHQNWFDEASCFAQSLSVQVKVPDSVIIPRDSLLKPGSYYNDTMSVPLVDHLINMVKDYFSNEYKEALNLLSLVPCSVTRSSVFEMLKSKPPLYIGDLPDPDNFFTELSCWKVNWKSKVASVTIPETIFQTLRLPLMQYFININTLLKIMCVLPSTALEYCGEVKRHKMYQDYVSTTSPMDRSPCSAMLQVGIDFNRDLDQMVAQCLRLTPKTLEGICLSKESKTLGRAAEMKTEDDTHLIEEEDREAQQDSRILVMNSEITGSEADIHKGGAESIQTLQQSENIEVFAGCLEVASEEPHVKVEEVELVPDENGHSNEPADSTSNCDEVFKQEAKLARRNCSLIDLSKPEQDAVVQNLASCHWVQEEGKLFSEGEMLQRIVKAIQQTILTEVHDSPFFSIVTDRTISVGEVKFLPVFVRYVNDCIPKVELIKSKEISESKNGDGVACSPQVIDEETLNKEFLKSLFDLVMMMGTQNIPLHGHSDKEPRSKSFTPSNFQALLEYRINAGDEFLRKKFEGSSVNLEHCSSTQLQQMLEVIENCVREDLLAEVKEGRFFSLVVDNLVEIGGESHLPLFIRFVDNTNCLREEFVGFLLFEGDVEAITERLIAEVTEKCGLDMQYCRGQAYLCSGVSAMKVKAVVARIAELNPLAVLTPCSSCSLNICLANTMTLTGVHLVMSTLKKLDAFFSKTPLLQNQLESAISIYYQGHEEKANVLKEACYSKWTEQHDTFEVAVDLLESLLLCMDSVHDNEDHKWSDEVAHKAFVISEALADFEFVMTLVVLKNTLSFSRAFGKNLQGQTNEVFFASSSLTAVLHSLNGVYENIEVYHEFWFEEAVNLAAALEIPVKVPRLYYRRRPTSGEKIQPETYYKEHVTIPVVSHVIKELSDLFSENHLKALKSLSLVPAIMGQLKFNTAEETSADIYKDDLLNPDTFPAELHCWKIKWKHGTKDVVLPSTIYETLQLSDVKFFPNVCALLKVLYHLPVFALTNDKCSTAKQRLKTYLEDTPVHHRNKSMALFFINCGIKHDLDTMVEKYLKMYPNSELSENHD